MGSSSKFNALSLYSPAVKHYYECTKITKSNLTELSWLILWWGFSCHTLDVDMDSSEAHPQLLLQAMRKNRHFEGTIHLTYFTLNESYSGVPCPSFADYKGRLDDYLRCKCLHSTYQISTSVWWYPLLLSRYIKTHANLYLCGPRDIIPQRSYIDKRSTITRQDNVVLT